MCRDNVGVTDATELVAPPAEMIAPAATGAGEKGVDQPLGRDWIERFKRIAREEKPITADTAPRLGKFFKTGAAFWMNIQALSDLEAAEDVRAPQLAKILGYEAGKRASGTKLEWCPGAERRLARTDYFQSFRFWRLKEYPHEYPR